MRPCRNPEASASPNCMEMTFQAVLNRQQLYELAQALPRAGGSCMRARSRGGGVNASRAGAALGVQANLH
jgi:hypothetical protein